MSTPQILKGDFCYEIIRLICEGGMGQVYEARQIGAQGFVKRVAIKIIHDRFAKQPVFMANFAGEARLVADLIHTNIVQTYHFEQYGETCFICMELIRGLNLEEFLQRLRDREQPLPRELAVFIVSRIARGLAYAHKKSDETGVHLGIVHRDINPKNILISLEGDVKLTDFGIAKARGFLTDREGEEVAGKPEYMSPEQADFQITDRRSDLFSAGVVLCRLLLGRNLFHGKTAEESRERIIQLPIPNFTQLIPDLEAPLEQILQRTLERDLSRRYQTADELLYDLEYFMYHGGYGPTNETLGRFIRGLLSDENASVQDPTRGGTVKLDSKRLAHSNSVLSDTQTKNA